MDQDGFPETGGASHFSSVSIPNVLGIIYSNIGGKNRTSRQNCRVAASDVDP